MSHGAVSPAGLYIAGDRSGIFYQPSPFVPPHLKPFDLLPWYISGTEAILNCQEDLRDWFRATVGLSCVATSLAACGRPTDFADWVVPL